MKCYKLCLKCNSNLTFTKTARHETQFSVQHVDADVVTETVTNTVKVTPDAAVVGVAIATTVTAELAAA